jgi:hypothetical protein
MLWKESVQVITNVWKCWNVCQEMAKTGRFIMGNWIEFSRITIDDSFEYHSLFEYDFLRDVVKLDNISLVVQECCSRLNKRKLGKSKNNNKAIYWNEINYTKDDGKVINFRRGVIKKANASVEKVIFGNILIYFILFYLNHIIDYPVTFNTYRSSIINFFIIT